MPAAMPARRWKRGLELMQTVGANPFKFGMIGSTDSHTSLATADEDNFFGKHPGNELNDKERIMEPQNLGTRRGRFGWHYLASGYAAAWATSNSREAIFDAFQRREVLCDYRTADDRALFPAVLILPRATRKIWSQPDMKKVCRWAATYPAVMVKHQNF